ncbi:MAG: PQQ-like beta-propeller repeat protein [Pirellula sp.]|nr:PQQ-like beta-propeller repeat protein [Pirellula sp.]
MMPSPVCCRTLHARLPICSAILALGFGLWTGSGNPVLAQVNDQSVAPAGLEVHWEGSLGGAGLARSEQNMVVWAHSSERREFVDVFLGNRLIERIDARQVDRAALDRLIVEGKPTKPVPTLGMQGAQERAAKLVKTYAVLGRQLTVTTFSEPVIYVVTLASNGILTAFDGESGEVLWQTSLPHANLQLLGPGVSDDYVTVVNGNYYFAMSLKNGSLVATRVLEHTATSAPVPLKDKILVPSIGGRVAAYDIANPLLSPVVLRAGKENRNGTAISSNREFIAWTSQKSLFMIHNERTPTMWAKVNAGDDVQTRPIATPQGFLFATNNGVVIHATTDRVGSYLWRANLALQTGRPAVVGNDRVFIVADDGEVQCMDLQTGKALWPTTTKNVDLILGVGKEHIYARDTSGMLESIRISDGKVDGQTTALLQGVVPNSIHDRFFVVTRTGHLTCLREKGAIKPTMWIELKNPTKEKPKETTTPTRPEPTRPTNMDDDPFGADLKPTAPAGDAKDPFDPF